ncbi:MAG TPA: FAD-dependent oxidoreductase [Planctomycetota bacterium]|jgi:hypothetical protein
MKTLMQAGLISAVASVCCFAGEVPESARKIPLAYNVDVVVVGGGVGGVSAAIAAAKGGAKVFLAAPRTYLGEDVAGTLRVWTKGTQDSTDRLTQKLFAGEGRDSSDFRGRLPFTYKADKPSSAQHKDSSPPSMLSDGNWTSAVSQSVQYDSEVTLTADLGKAMAIDRAGVMAYHAKDYCLDSVIISISADGKEWKEVGTVKNTAKRGTETSSAVELLTSVGATARYVQIQTKIAENSRRVLLGEIVITGPDKGPVADDLTLVKPLHIKRALDEALIAAGVQYLFGCYASDILRDAEGKPAGIVMANRAGRQAVTAKVIIDATDRAWVARMAGAKAKDFPAGPQVFRRVVIGGELHNGDGVTGQKLPVTAAGYPVFDYELKIPMKDGSFASYAEAEQKARDLTFDTNQRLAADLLFQVPPDPIVSVKAGSAGAPAGSAGVPAGGVSEWPGAAKVDLDAFKPAGVERMLLIGGCADLPRPQAEKLLEPGALIDVGARIGAAAATLAKSVPEVGRASLPAISGVGAGTEARPTAGEVKELLTGVRPSQTVPTIDETARGLPVLATYDVVVIGGGTSGAPAGIAAARQGAKTLVVEYQCGLGGVGTLGMIATYYWGNRVGFTKEVENGLASWSPERRQEWWRTALRKAGGDIWFGAMGCGAYVADARVQGAVVATPQGRGVILAKVVIDATGAADVAAAAGAPTVTTGGDDVALQGTGLPPRILADNYTNTDYTLVDETDLVDIWRTYVFGKQMAKNNAFDFGTLIDTRERRRIAGEFTITALDAVLGRTYPDTIMQANSNFDSHGYTVDPFFTLSFPHHKGMPCDVPFRAMLPKGLEGLLVVGLGMSVHRDALPLVRMQPDLQNGGYAAGVAAAMSSKAGMSLRAIDMKALQQELVKVGNIKEGVVGNSDNFPLSLEKVQAAVQKTGNTERDTAVILAHAKESLPLVKTAFAAEKDEKEKVRWARLLAILGDPSGLDVLIAALEEISEFDKGWQYKGMGQFGPNMSPLDTIVYALGRIGDKKATPALIRKLKLLKPDTEFSHFRALALALDRVADPLAAGALAEVISIKGVRGQAVTQISGAIDIAKQYPSWTATEPRANALRELFLARALFHSGDKDGLGRKILEEYAKDLRGHFAKHASEVLKAAVPAK